MAIAQTIGTIRTLADAPNPLTDTQEVFDSKGYAYTQSQKDVNADMQSRVTELNTFATQVNDTEQNINTIESQIETAKNDIFLARDEALGAVATLPDGIINNGTVSETDTWSSKKINSTKLDKTIDIFLEQLTVTAYNYVNGDLTSVVYEGGYKVVYSYLNGNLYQEKFYDTDQTTLLLTKTYNYDINNNLISVPRS